MCEEYGETVEWNPYLRAKVYYSDTFIIYSIYHYDKRQKTLWGNMMLRNHWVNLHG